MVPGNSSQTSFETANREAARRRNLPMLLTEVSPPVPQPAKKEVCPHHSLSVFSGEVATRRKRMALTQMLSYHLAEGQLHRSLVLFNN